MTNFLVLDGKETQVLNNDESSNSSLIDSFDSTSFGSFTPTSSFNSIQVGFSFSRFPTENNQTGFRLGDVGPDNLNKINL